MSVFKINPLFWTIQAKKSSHIYTIYFHRVDHSNDNKHDFCHRNSVVYKKTYQFEWLENNL